MNRSSNRYIERRGSDSIKWRRYARTDTDVIGAWVADMDLPTSEAIIEAVAARLEEGVFGYTEMPDALLEVLMARLEERYGWQTEPQWFVTQPGIVPALFFATSCLGESGDAVMAPDPNYHYFLETARYRDRIFQPVPSGPAAGRWSLDFDQMAETLGPRTRTFMMCNPWNPVGRVLDTTELETIAALCLENRTMIVSDEIHADLVLDEDKAHTPIATLSREVAANSITLVSPSKAFNLPGIGTVAFAIIPNPELRAAFEHGSYGVATHPSALAYAAALAAYRDSAAWLAEVIDYLKSNRDLVEAEVATLPGVTMQHVEGTFLAWLDVSASGLEEPLETLLENGVALSGGSEMGSSDHLRLNFACHRTTLEEILRRLRTTFS